MTEINDNIQLKNYLALRDKLDEFLIQKNNVSNNISNNTFIENKNEKNGCCVCYEHENIFIVKTSCNHNICMSCLTQLTKMNCPMCRKEFPKEIKTMLKKSYNDPQPICSTFSWSGTPETIGYYINNI